MGRHDAGEGDLEAVPHGGGEARDEGGTRGARGAAEVLAGGDVGIRGQVWVPLGPGAAFRWGGVKGGGTASTVCMKIL
jgi:hypothetical protein